MKAVVMAGGEGSRLRPLTIARPKPMIPIVNKPCIEHILLLLKKHGIREVVITVQYLASSIQEYFGDGSSWDMDITYSVEDTPLGTAGSVKHAAQSLTEPFLVISGDALTDFDLTKVLAFHQAKKSMATITLYRVPNPLEYGVVIINEEGAIRQFLEKPSWGEVFSDTVNTGIYVLDPRVFDYYESGRPVDFSQDVFPELLRAGEPIFGFVADGYWCDVGNIQEYIRASWDVLSGKVNVGSLGKHVGGDIWCESDEVSIAPDAQLFGPLFIGDDCKIRSGAIVHGPSVIRRSTVIDKGAHVARTIIFRDSYIGERAELRGAIVGRQCSIKARAMIFEGVVVGDSTTVAEDSIIQPNVKIWPNKEIERGATVSSSIIWGSQGRRVLFGRWGVTGLANIDLTPEFGAKLGAAYGGTLPKGSTVIVNRDPHRTPRMIKRAMISGLPSAGINVLDIKSVPLPVARYLTRTSDTMGGIHVQLSPFDPRVVDIKFFDSRGLEVDKVSQRKIENTFFREDFRRVYLDEIGSINEAPTLIDNYMVKFVEALGIGQKNGHGTSRPLVVDYANATAANILPALFNRMGLDVVSLNAAIDENRLSRSPEEFDQDIRQLASVVAALRAELGVRIDAGGERIYVVDERGEVVPGPTLLAVVAALELKSKGGTIAVPVSASRVFEEIAQAYGGSVVRTKVDPHALMLAATREDVVLAGDGEGGFAFPQIQPAFDGLFAIANLVQLLRAQGVRLSDVIDSLPKHHVVRTRVSCPWEAKGKVMRLLNEQYRDRRTRQIDGVKVDLGREWVLVLPDADRPLFHVIAESTSREGAQALADKYTGLINGLQR